MKVAVGDGRKLYGKGIVLLIAVLADGSTSKCWLCDVIYIPGLSHSLLSVSKAAENSKITRFNDKECEILKNDSHIIARDVKCGNLYYLDCCPRRPDGI